MHFAAFNRQNRFRARHLESSAEPETRPFCIRISWIGKVSTKVAGIECRIRFTPIGAQRGNRIFQHPRSLRPFADPPTRFNHRDRFGKPCKTFPPKPPGTANRQIGAWRKGENDFVVHLRRKPVPHIRANKSYPTFLRDSLRMLLINADAFVACLCPWLNHVASAVAKGQHNAALKRAIRIRQSFTPNRPLGQ